jgi:hypothetical protein
MTNSYRFCIAFLWVSLLLTTICSAATITQTYGVFDVTFYNTGDSDGKYTADADWTSEQMADLEASLNAWQSQIGNTAGRQIQLHMFWNNLNISGGKSLGGSINQRMQAGGQIWNSTEYIWKTGQQVITNKYGYDTAIQLDITAAGTSWNFGSDAPGTGEVDFRSVLTHELGHSLGWDTTYDISADDWGWMYTNRPNGFYAGLTSWDKNLVDGSGNKPANGGTGTPGNFNQTDNPVYFDGANATALYGGLVPIYAPQTYTYASSLIHLDDAAFSDFAMSYSIGLGQTARTISDLELAMMQDMGWTVVPEPSSVILMISAFSMLRLKKRK